MHPPEPEDRERRRFQRDVLWNVASLAVLGVSGIALFSLIGRFYDADTLGAFYQVLSAYIVFSMLAVGGIDRSVLRAVVERSDDRQEGARIALGSLVPALVLALPVSLLFWASGSVLADWLESEAVAQGIEAATPGLFFFALNKVLLGVVNGLRRMRAFAVYQAARYVLILVGLVACVLLEVPGERLPLLFSIAELALFAILAVEVSTQLPWWRARGWLSWSGVHLRYGTKSVLSGVLLELNSKVDVLMLGLFLADFDVGIYTVAAQLAEGAFQLLVVLQNNYNPLLARHLAGGRLEELRVLVARGRRVAYGLFAAVAVVAVLLYPLAVRLLIDKPEFQASWMPFALLMAGITLAAGYLPFQHALLMGNRPAWHSAYMLLVVGLNAAGNALLIPRYGIEGAALATGLSFVAAAALLYGLARGLLGLRL